MKRHGLLVAIVALGSLVAAAPRAHAANWSCGWVTTVQSGVGSSGSVLGRHTLQTAVCSNKADTKDGSNLLHTATTVGWTQFFVSLSTDGDSIAKLGTSFIGTGKAKSEFCVLRIAMCTTKKPWIKNTMLADGTAIKTVSSWNI